jgi:UDP-3-O-[3-hydroxymyristoyl] glucosamine N-acyltransferase
MQKTARELAAFLGGQVEGSPDAVVSRLSKIEEGVAGSLTFLANPAYETHLYETEATVAIVAKGFQGSRPLPAGLTLIRVEEPYAAFGRLLEWVEQVRSRPEGVHPTAIIEPGAVVESGCRIGAYVVIEAGARIETGCDLRPHVVVGREARVGAGSLLHAGVHVHDGCVVGKECVLHTRAVVGSDGFGFAPQQDATYRKIPQTGNVILGDRCEIGAGTTIDRATLGSTRIGNGVKLDNLIQIGHNVSIGDHTVIAALTGIAGSTTIGAHCMIGGQVGIAGHLHIADGVKIAAQSGIGASIVHPGTIMQGTPAAPLKEFQRRQITLKHLSQGDVLNRLTQLENRID